VTGPNLLEAPRVWGLRTLITVTLALQEFLELYENKPKNKNKNKKQTHTHTHTYTQNSKEKAYFLF
jgi:hypothetical protein